MSNPLSILRKLGSGLVGPSGLLTDAASAALGYDHKARINSRLQAEEIVRGEQEAALKARKGEQDLLKGAIDIDAGEQSLEDARYASGRQRTLDTRADATRSRLPVAMTDEDMTIDSPEDAEAVIQVGDYRRKRGDQKLTKEMKDYYTGLGIAVEAEPGQHLTKAQVDFLEDQARIKEKDRDRSEDHSIRREMAAQSRANTNALREIASSGKAFTQEQQLANSIENLQPVKDYNKTLQGTGAIEAAVGRTKGHVTGQAALVLINAFQHQVDPGAVTRGEDVKLITGGQPWDTWFDQIKAKVRTGAPLAPSTVLEIQKLSREITASNRKIALDAVRPSIHRGRRYLPQTPIINYVPPDLVDAFDEEEGEAAAESTLSPLAQRLLKKNKGGGR